ncbi:MAG: hypothetical protein HQL26_02655 [Candidatus Omnitrophica bacterium]|nr:hypothetical protein [Candidatus Omnitrophota bacterium]
MWEFYWSLAYIAVFVVCITSRMERGLKLFSLLVISLTLLWIQHPVWLARAIYHVKMFFCSKGLCH